MEIFYLNDDKKPIVVQTIGTLQYSEEYPYGLPDIQYVTLQPGESKVFKFETPTNSVPYIKRWEKMVLLSYIDQLGLHSLRESGALKD